jgi:hypothetical protein
MMKGKVIKKSLPIEIRNATILSQKVFIDEKISCAFSAWSEMGRERKRVRGRELYHMQNGSCTFFRDEDLVRIQYAASAIISGLRL